MSQGKTLTMLSLVLATKSDVPPAFSKATLIGKSHSPSVMRDCLTLLRPPVVPLSVISNWEKQIEEHCVREVLSSCVYYGATRSMSPKELTKYDVVITTYQVCSRFQFAYRPIAHLTGS